MASLSSSDGGQGRPESRDLLIGIGIACGLAILVFAGLYQFGRSDLGVSTASSDLAGELEPGGVPGLPPSWSPEPLPEQKLFTTKRPRALGTEPSVINPPSPATAQSSARPATAPASSEPPAGEAAADTEPGSEDGSTDMRGLLKRMRKQVKGTRPGEALETAREIAALVPDTGRRQKLEDRLGDADAAAAAGQLVDFDSLIQLIEQTIAPGSWESVGGAGTIQPFPGGVYVDSTGLLRRRLEVHASAELARVRQEARPVGDTNAAGGDGLRKVSLPRLEAEVARRITGGQPLDDELRYLAGLQEIRYVLAYPEEHDLILVGPAEPWRQDAAGRVVGQTSGVPVLRLEDLAVVFRACFSEARTAGFFGCGIYPRAERLQQVQEFLARSAQAGPIEPSQREHWLESLRDQLGQQDIRVFGIHPGSRVAHVLVEADYRMKLIGIGLEPAAVAGIPSYFDILGQPDDARLERPIDTLRWWFTLKYDSMSASEQLDAFKLSGGRVRVLSENELLTATGQRVHTGQSDPMNATFARNFTDHYPELARQDVNFADLAGIFDLAVVGGLLRGYELPHAVGWQLSTLLDPDELVIPLNAAPETVETVLNFRVFRGRHIMAAVSGGVHVDTGRIVARDRILPDSDGTLRSVRASTRPAAAGRHWWWD